MLYLIIILLVFWFQRKETTFPVEINQFYKFLPFFTNFLSVSNFSRPLWHNFPHVCFIFLTQVKKLKFFSTRKIKPIEKLISDPDLLYGSFSLHRDKKNLK